MANVPTAPATPPTAVDDGLSRPHFHLRWHLGSGAASNSMKTWTLDLGYRGQLGAFGRAGVVSAMSARFGDVPRAAPLTSSQGSHSTSVAASSSPPITLFRAPNLSNAGYHIGLDGRFGQSGSARPVDVRRRQNMTYVVSAFCSACSVLTHLLSTVLADKRCPSACPCTSKASLQKVNGCGGGTRAVDRTSDLG